MRTSLTLNRIGFLTTSFPRFKGDYAGTFVYDMALNFNKIGIKTDIIVPQTKNNGPTAWREKNYWPEGMSIFPFSYALCPSKQRLFFEAGAPHQLVNLPGSKKLALQAGFAMSLKAASLVSRWNALISHWILPSSLAAAPLKPKIPHLCIAHSGDIHLLSTLPAKKALASVILKNSTHMGFVSKQLKEEFASMLGNKYLKQLEQKAQIITMGVQKENFISKKKQPECRKQLALTDFTVLFLGRLEPIKGLDVLIKALEGTNIKLIVAGDGPLSCEMKALAKKLNVDARFLGFVDSQKRAQLLCACDLLILPSKTLKNNRHEGLPVTIAEAQISGIPIVATRTGAIEDIIKDGQNGLLCPNQDHLQMRAAILKIKQDKKLAQKLTKKALLVAQQKTWDKLILNYSDLLTSPLHSN